MNIDKDTLHKIAHLARLEIRPDEEAAMMAKLEGVLNWMEQLNEVDTAGVEPLRHMTMETNKFRDDEARLDISRAEGLSNAPKHDGTYFRINKVL
jgi:aspartyl-tRNA(Asn)/glutamyl-tRNA(Gln) amidotransferase subunit C